jgi:TolB protein
MKSSARTNMKNKIAAGIVFLLCLGCKDATSPNQSAAISVSVKLAGVYPFYGFAFRVDDRPVTLPTTEPSLIVRGLSAGTHTVALVGLPETCVITGVNPVTVETSPADLSTVQFDVNCLASAGAISVAVSVTGYAKQLWFQAQVDTAAARATVKGNATTVLVGSYPGGTHDVRLSGIPTFCEPTGEVSTSVNIKTGGAKPDTAMALFNLNCTPPELGADTAAAIVFERDGYVQVIKEAGGVPTALAEGASPAWSPDGKLIVFEKKNCDADQYCEKDLWLMNAAGENRRRVIEDPNFDDYDPTFSPGADKLAFIRTWLGPDQSYLAISDLHGGSVGILSIWNAVFAPSWSPDGTRIVYVCIVEWPGYLHLCLADPSRPCDSYFTNRCNLPAVQLTSGAADVEHPAWSPDGKRIAFTVGCTRYCGIDSPAAAPYIAILNVSTREIKRIVDGHDAAWSPDGSQLVLAGNAGAPGLKVYTLADGSVRELTHNPADRSPSWRE